MKWPWRQRVQAEASQGKRWWAKWPFMLATLALSLALYSLLFDIYIGVGVILMLLVHELGHYWEMRRQGVKASLPIFIPFVGAAVVRLSKPLEVHDQARVALWGPLWGTIGTIVVLSGYAITGWKPLLVTAWLGSAINLLNLVPAWPMDGGWVMGAVSKWFGLLGAGLWVTLTWWVRTPMPVTMAVLGMPMLIARLRGREDDRYNEVSHYEKVTLGVAWAGLVVVLGLVFAFSLHVLLSH